MPIRPFPGMQSFIDPITGVPVFQCYNEYLVSTGNRYKVNDVVTLGLNATREWLVTVPASPIIVSANFARQSV